MIIDKPQDLFTKYNFSDECKAKIFQLYNADKKNILIINALCYCAKTDSQRGTLLYKNCYILKSNDIKIIYRIESTLEIIDADIT